jgi:hypothetical protein
MSACEAQCTWKPEHLAGLLHDQDYDALVTALQAYYDARDPRVVNWSIEFGYRQGHVPVLHLLAHNFLRYSKGRVPTIEDLAFGTRCALLLLLRVFQDVASCKLDLAKADRDGVYPAFLSSVQLWLLNRWTDDVLPSPAEVAVELETWLQKTKSLPLPTWASCFSSGFMGGMYWAKPSSHDVTSFKRCTNVAHTQAAAAAQFIDSLKTSGNWHVFLHKNGAL